MLDSVPSYDPAASHSERQLLFNKEFAAAYWRIYACALAIVADKSDVEDVMQEVAVVLWKKFDQFEAGTSFASWACRVAYIAAKEHVRKKSKTAGVELTDEALSKLYQAHTGVLELLELRRSYLDECLSEMPSKDRAFVLKAVNRHGSVSKLARQYQQPAHQLYAKLNRLRKRLADCIGQKLKGDE
ncbi:sigma-70 family RNA polymerase sigma factor [Calycomorphotria hydatis]|uniref:ECF RNA polymerase sigma factor SigH n=1 Tax=Calycomorphotria hydatis TaxID=2528027 RepID=A0A517TFA2_9PLAN|nr:sigma-70 family RNA polymerase sigma factor [Calycomorphotria hydatis]QDT67045.1 ECF RNA polymerase sigma factor SigH [Calycomorphotria hydatis]